MPFFSFAEKLITIINFPIVYKHSMLFFSSKDGTFYVLSYISWYTSHFSVFRDDWIYSNPWQCNTLNVINWHLSDFTIKDQNLINLSQKQLWHSTTSHPCRHRKFFLSSPDTVNVVLLPRHASEIEIEKKIHFFSGWPSSLYLRGKVFLLFKLVFLNYLYKNELRKHSNFHR